MPYKVMGGRGGPTASILLASSSDMTVFRRVVLNADWLRDLVRFGLIILIRRRDEVRRGEGGQSRGYTRAAEFGVERRFFRSRRLWLREGCLKTRGRG